MGIPPQPWQLKTFEDKYTPYFRPTHALPVPGFYATPTLTNTKAFPPERRPTSISERLRPAPDTRKADSPKKTKNGMGTATNVLDIWSELYRPKQPIVSPSIPSHLSQPPTLTPPLNQKPIYTPEPPTVLSPSQKRRWQIAYASKLIPLPPFSSLLPHLTTSQTSPKNPPPTTTTKIPTAYAHMGN